MDFFKDFLAKLAAFLRMIFNLIGEDTSGLDSIFPPETEEETTEQPIA